MFEDVKKQHENSLKQARNLYGRASEHFANVLMSSSAPKAKKKAKRSVNTAALYKKLVVHPEIRAASQTLFMDGHFPSATLEAFKMVNILVKKKSGRSDLDGHSLMSTVFSENAPILKWTRLVSDSDKSEQRGFMMLFMGAMAGIRNPGAHDIVDLKDPIKALQYLALADMLARRVDESTK
jgi:uncharacterized protein (TIGR02391 family)